MPGAALPGVHLLRSAGDATAILASAEGARDAVVIGTSFIGLEAASALRKMLRTRTDPLRLHNLWTLRSKEKVDLRDDMARRCGFQPAVVSGWANWPPLRYFQR